MARQAASRENFLLSSMDFFGRQPCHIDRPALLPGRSMRYPVVLSLSHRAQRIDTMPCISFKTGRYDHTPTAAVLMVRNVGAVTMSDRKSIFLGKFCLKTFFLHAQALHP